MLIRQVNNPSQGRYTAPQPETSAGTGIAVQVDTTHQLIGESFYDPKVKFTNGSDSPITVTDIELLARGKTYADGKFRVETLFPLTVPPRSTESFEADFDLDSYVKEIFFRKPAELLVHYRLGEEERVIRVTIVGANLDGSR